MEGDPGGRDGEDRGVVDQLGQHKRGDQADLGVEDFTIGPNLCIIVYIYIFFIPHTGDKASLD